MESNSTAFGYKNKTASQPWQAIAQLFCSIVICREQMIVK